MIPFTFQVPQNVLFESGAVKRIGQFVRDMGFRRVLLVSDPGVRKAGLIDAAEVSLRKASCEVTIFTDVVPDPPVECVQKAVSAGSDAKSEIVLGIGGGSALDIAKLAAYLIRSRDNLEQIYGVGLAKGERLPLLLTPTTAGTGSEVTPIAIVTTGSNEKKGVVSTKLIADWAILDPELTLSLPPKVTVATGIDAIVHAIEAFTSRIKKNPVSDQLAKTALALLSGNIRTVFTSGADHEARSQMLLGSCLAGMAFSNAPVAAVHALAYPIGALFHVPHGLSNALILPHVLRFNMPAAEPLYSELAPILVPNAAGRSEQERAQLMVGALEAICRDCGVPSSLADVGILEADLPKLAFDAMQQTRLLANNPRHLTLHDAQEIYKAALD